MFQKYRIYIVLSIFLSAIIYYLIFILKKIEFNMVFSFQNLVNYKYIKFYFII